MGLARWNVKRRDPTPADSAGSHWTHLSESVCCSRLAGMSTEALRLSSADSESPLELDWRALSGLGRLGPGSTQSYAGLALLGSASRNPDT